MNLIFQKKSFKSFNILVIGSVFIISVLLTIFLNVFFTFIFQNTMEKKNYYNSLYGNSDIGCSTLEYINPEILFIGDSTGYHSWDFNLFEKKTQKRIGTCFLQGFSILSIEQLFNFLNDKDIKPNYIILSNSYRIFLNKKINEGFVKQHENYLQEIRESKYQKELKIISKILRKKELFKTTVPIDEEINIFLRDTELSKIDKIISNIILENKGTGGYQNYKKLIEAYNNQNFNFKMHRKKLNILCKYIKNNKTKLILTNVPISKTIQKLVWAEKNENDNKIIKYLKKCTNNQIYYDVDLANNYLSNKHFILTNNNKNDYSKFIKYLNNQKNINYVSSFFDFTHMNRYGSKIFTEAWLKKNKIVFKNKNK